MKNGIYVYGVIKTSGPKEFGEIGIGDKASNVLTIGFKDLAAVVSCNPFKVYDSLAKEETVKDLVTHQFVIEKVMESFTIIPVKFGTMVETEDDVVKFLDKGYFLLRNALRKMEGKIELDVVATWKLPKAAVSLCRRSPRIRRKQAEVVAKGGEAALEDKIVLGKLVERVLNTKKVRFSGLILKALRKEAIDVVLHDLAGEEMVFNAAFLVEKKSEEFFNKAVNLLDKKLEDILNFRVVGPLPPYSFSTILLERIDPHEVKEAEKTLCLNGKITEKTVRDAYRQLAREFHPDKQSLRSDELKQSLRPAPDGAGLKNVEVNPLQFHLIDSAYRVLKNFLERGYFHVDIYRFEGRL